MEIEKGKVGGGCPRNAALRASLVDSSEGVVGVAVVVAEVCEVDHAADAGQEKQAAEHVPALPVRLGQRTVLDVAHVHRVRLLLVLLPHYETNFYYRITENRLIKSGTSPTLLI